MFYAVVGQYIMILGTKLLISKKDTEVIQQVEHLKYYCMKMVI